MSNRIWKKPFGANQGDNFVLAEGGFTGKGYLADAWFRRLEIACLHRGHQFAWQL